MIFCLTTNLYKWARVYGDLDDDPDRQYEEPLLSG